MLLKQSPDETNFDLYQTCNPTWTQHTNKMLTSSLKGLSETKYALGISLWLKMLKDFSVCVYLTKYKNE